MSAFIRIAALWLGLLGAAPVYAQNPPAEFADLYALLDNKLTSFLATIESRWDGSKAPVLHSAGLVTANGNAGASLLVPNRRVGVQLELDRLASLGTNAVTVNVSFPLFYEPFFTFNQTPAQYGEFIDFYRFVASEVRRRGMFLIVETGVLFPGFFSADSGFDLDGFYATLNASTLVSGRATTAANIARELKPDYLSVGAEPDNEAMLTGIHEIGSPSGWGNLVRTIVTEVRNAGSLVPIGSGIGTWEPRGIEYIDSIIAAGADYIDLHVYPVNGDILDATVAFADHALNRGVRVGMSEAWLLKQRDEEFGRISAATDPQIFARDSFSFWAPLDQKFLDAMTNLAHFKDFIFLSPFWAKYFWAYLNYSDVSHMSAAQITQLSNAAASQAILEAEVTGTGVAYDRLTEPPNAGNVVAVLSAASFASASMAPEIIASAFGSNLANSTSAAETLPLPTELGGTTVTIADNSGREQLAELLYVSPNQVNFLFPAGMELGWGTVRVRSPSFVSEAHVLVRRVAPSLFSANFRGTGVAAATFMIVRPDGSHTDSLAATCTADRNCTPVAIDLGGANDRAFLSLFGSGIRGRSSLSNVRVTIGEGTTLTPLYAGPQLQFEGLDQVNVELPKSLRGAGLVNVELRVDGALANIVTVQIR